MPAKSPGRGKGRQALEWEEASKQPPTPSGCPSAVVGDRCRCAVKAYQASTPSRERIFLARLAPCCVGSLSHDRTNP